MVRVFGLLAVFATSIGLVAASGPDYSLHVTHELTSTACRWKPRGLVNGTSPGPVMTMYENVTTWIRVYNDMTDQNLTMHLHGLGASVPFSDGTPMISQWPIAPGQFFDHQIQPNKAGTYFYQAGFGMQAVSVAGPIVVLEAGADTAPPYQYDAEKFMILQEYFNQTDEVIVDGLTSSPSVSPGETEAILVNGNSYPAIDGAAAGAPEPWYTENNDMEATCGPEIVEVYPNSTYRIRTIGATALSLVAYKIEGHDNLTVIGADGEYTYPIYTDMIIAGPGQRYDFLLNTMSYEEIQRTNKTDYWIQLETRLRPKTLTSYAILRYVSGQSNSTANNTSAPPPNAVYDKRSQSRVRRQCSDSNSDGSSTPGAIYNTTNLASFPASPPSSPVLSIPTDIQNWLEYQCSPVFLNPQLFPPPQNVSRTVFLENRQTPDGDYWTVNNVTWTPADRQVPYLIDIYQRGDAALPGLQTAQNATQLYDPELNVYAGKKMEVIDFVFLNIPNGRSDGYHARPWHFHSAHAWDLGSGPGEYNATANNQKMYDIFGTRGPSKRDTTMLWSYDQGFDPANAGTVQGWRALRFIVISTGTWLMNSQVLADQVMGQNAIWIMGNNAAMITTTVPNPYVDGYLEFGGSAVSNATYDPLTHQFPDETTCAA